MKYLSAPPLFIVALCLSACTKTPELTHLEGFSQGTTYHFTFDLKNKSELPTIEQEIATELTRLDKEISNYRDDSTIEKFNAQPSTEPQEITEEIVNLIEIARHVSKASNGCYDLTIKPLFDLWGFKKDTFHLPSDEELQQTRALVDMNKLETLDKNHIRKMIPTLRVDLSSIGQGYSVGRITNILESHHIENYLVEIGGELKARGKKTDGSSWRVAVEKPLANQRKLEKIAVFDSGNGFALTPSGTYRHYFDNDGKRYSHILDAHTGKPVEHNTLATVVLDPDPTIADAWDTALLCMGSEEGIKVANENGIAVLFIDQVGEALVEKNSRAFDALKDVSFEAVDK